MTTPPQPPNRNPRPPNPERSTTDFPRLTRERYRERYREPSTPGTANSTPDVELHVGRNFCCFVQPTVPGGESCRVEFPDSGRCTHSCLSSGTASVPVASHSLVHPGAAAFRYTCSGQWFPNRGPLFSPCIMPTPQPDSETRARGGLLGWMDRHMEVHAPVFWPAAVLVIAFVTISIIKQHEMLTIFRSLQDGIATVTGWFFVLTVNFLLGFALILAFTRYGNIRLGGPKATPEFTTVGWFSMLFSAGMGIGLLFWSVGEPLTHFANPPLAGVEPRSAEAAKVAMSFTLLHWGFHAWGIYAVVGLALAFFTFNLDQPLTVRSIFYPLLGNRAHGPLGHLIDVLAVLSTLFGLATSLGLGVSQISEGLKFVFDIEISPTLLIIGITLMATASVVAGLDKGVRRLSELNMAVGALLLVAVLLAGPTLFILNSMVENIGFYFQNFASLSFWTESYQQTSWQNHWTVYYWAWWIAWSPFVGMFIARVSRGRTIREFILGVLIVPTLVTIIWVTAYGGSALYEELFLQADLVSKVEANVATAMFEMFALFPMSTLLSVLGVLLVISFFVTSSDSGSLVVDSLTSGGALDAPVAQRIFWALAEGAVAAVLMLSGGENDDALNALQAASITTGLPFAMVLILMCVSFYKGLRSYERGNPENM